MSPRARTTLALAVSAAVLATSPFFGAKLLGPLDVFESLGAAADSLDVRIFWTLRVPRAIFSWCAGAALAICGMVFQALFRNPLADPSMLGVSSGASLGAAAAIKFGLAGGSAALLTMPACAFIGAIAAVAIISAFARMARAAADASLLLAGIAMSALFSSIIMLFQYSSGAAETYRLISWTMGGISIAGMAEGMAAVPSLVISLAAALYFSTELDLMLFGDEIASTRGVSAIRLRRALFAAVSLSVAVIVARCGPISFVGLLAPHAARRISSPRHGMLAFASAAAGGAALTICDTAARTLWAPAELPVGIIISFLGAPFFMWMLISSRQRG